MRVKPLVHRDQIHKDTTLDPLSVALLDSAPLQRLGRVYQLGYAHLVFRGGTHTRLSHVMGASHVAGQLVKSLRNNYSSHNAEFRPPGAVFPADFLPFPGGAQQRAEKRASTRLENRWSFVMHICRWAALLHDVGHIPMGHTLEDEYEQIYPKHDDFTNPRLQSLWMDTKSGKVESNSEIKAILHDSSLYPSSFHDLNLSPGDVYDAVLLVCCHKEDRKSEKTFEEVLKATISEPIQQNLLGPATSKVRDLTFSKLLLEALQRQTAEEGRGGFRVFMADLVANTICADYLDYMQRDPYNVGLDVLSDPRVSSRFYVGSHPKWGQRMALSLVDRSGKPRMDTASGVFELVRQRFRFAETIYYHKTKVAASAMFVKALSLLRDPPEASGIINPPIELSDVDRLAIEVTNNPKSLTALRDRHTPKNLLSPDIGDDSIHMFLQNIAWNQIDNALKPKATGADQEDRTSVIRDAFAAISLLSAIVRRKLYKQCFFLDASSARSALSIPASSEETRLVALIKQLREDHDRRAALERAMCVAADVFPGAFIIYVPGRKSQAKGVETFALSKEGVITLGDHDSLSAKMSELNSDYKNLWRLLIFVHPSLYGEAIRISQAIDYLVRTLGQLAQGKREILGEAYLSTGSVEKSILEGARVTYVPRRYRQAATRLGSLCKADGNRPASVAALNDIAELAATRSQTLGSDTHAFAAFLATTLCAMDADNQLQDWAEDAVASLMDGDSMRNAIAGNGGVAFAADGTIDESQDAQVAAVLRKMAVDLSEARASKGKT
jgi:HD superfamily phosphohydrolase